MRRLVYLLAPLMLCGCHVFMHIKPDYRELPVESLNAVALEIEKAVQEGNREPGIQDRDGIVVSSDIVQQAIRTRAARVKLVNEVRDSGNAWERRNGHLYILRTREYNKEKTSDQKNRDALIVYNETQDRWAIYETIVRESKFPARSLSAVQEAFFKARLKCMPKGQKCEDESGETAYIGGAPIAKE